MRAVYGVVRYLQIVSLKHFQLAIVPAAYADMTGKHAKSLISGKPFSPEISEKLIVF